MSTVVRINGVSFKVLTSDHPPPHCHVSYQGAEAKIRIDTFEVLFSRGFAEHALGDIVRQVAIHQSVLLAKWEEYHGKEEEN